MQSLSRSFVKGDYGTITVPELDFEIPHNTQKGVMTTARARHSFSESGFVLDYLCGDALKRPPSSAGGHFVWGGDKLAVAPGRAAGF